MNETIEKAGMKFNIANDIHLVIINSFGNDRFYHTTPNPMPHIPTKGEFNVVIGISENENFIYLKVPITGLDNCAEHIFPISKVQIIQLKK